MSQGNKAAYEEIDIGARICTLLKEMYFVDIPWVDCYRQVADKFTLLKKILRKFYGISNQDELMEKVKLLDKTLIEDAFSIANDVLHDNALVVNGIVTRYAGKVTWIPVPLDEPELVETIRKMVVSV